MRQLVCIALVYCCSSFSVADEVLFRFVSYFASKECTYTDSTGRPVPAPNAARAGAANPHPLGPNSQGLGAATPAEIPGPYAPRNAQLPQADSQQAPSALSLHTSIAGPSHFGSTSSAPFASQLHASPVDARPRPTQFNTEAPVPTSSAPRKRLKGETETYDLDRTYTLSTQIPTPVSASGGPSQLTITAADKAQSHAQHLDPSGRLVYQLTHRKSPVHSGLNDCPLLSLIAADILDAIMEHCFQAF